MRKGQSVVIEMTAEATAQILENLIAHGKFNAMTRNAIENAARLLKDQPQVVRCKDCKWHENADNSPMWLPCIEMKTNGNWFCADGEAK